MEPLKEFPQKLSRVVESVQKKLSSFYEKHARINVTDEVVKSFDRVATTFQSEKGKRVVESIRPYIPTLGKIGEGLSATVDLLVGVVGFRSGIERVKTGMQLKNLALHATSESRPLVATAFSGIGNEMVTRGAVRAVGMPIIGFVGRPMSRALFYGTQGLGFIGEKVGTRVDQILLRKEKDQKKNVVLVGSAKPIKSV